VRHAVVRYKIFSTMTTLKKTCTKCGIHKSHSEFYKTSQSKDGLVWRCKSCHNAAVRSRYSPEKRKERGLKYLYGVSLEWYDSKLKEQDFGCAICGIKIPGGNGKHFYVDHNHSTGQVRDLLCHNCNFVIGYAKEDIDILLAVIEYLRIWGERS
jgi:hypothetical protein